MDSNPPENNKESFDNFPYIATSKIKPSTSELLNLIDRNDIIFKQLKQQLEDQLNAYESAFSREDNKYIEDRDFDHFKMSMEKFKRKSTNFVDKLLQIKNNCTKVISSLPTENKLVPSQSNNCFDMFVNEQIQQTLQYKMKTLRYDQTVKKPFQNNISDIVSEEME